MTLRGGNRMNIEERAELAATWKNEGRYNCCQAVAVVLKDQCELSEKQLEQIASGFAAGMGNMEGTCGALVGAGIIAGLKCNGQGTLRYTKQMADDFLHRSGAVTCKELKGRGTGKVLCSCEDCVRNAVLAYGGVLNLK